MRRHKGSAIIAALLLMALLAGISMILLSMDHASLVRTRGLLHGEQAYLHAESQLDFIREELHKPLESRKLPKNTKLIDLQDSMNRKLPNLPDGIGMNINIANKKALQSIGLHQACAEHVISRRTAKAYQKVEDFLAEPCVAPLNLNVPLVVESEYYLLVIESRFDMIVRTISVMLHRPKGTNDYAIEWIQRGVIE